MKHLLPTMSAPQSLTPGSLTDFVNAVEKLDATGSNWVVFERRFVIDVKQK